MTKLNLNALKYLYKHLESNDELKDDISSFDEFLDYVIDLVRDNIEFDYGVLFEDYVDLTQFIEEGED